MLVADNHYLFERPMFIRDNFSYANANMKKMKMPLSKTVKKLLKKANENCGVILIDLDRNIVDDPKKSPKWFDEIGYLQDAAEQNPRYAWKN